MVLFAALFPAAPLCAQDDCRVPPSLTITTRPLPHAAAGLRPGGHLEVLAVGSASLLGVHGGVVGSVPDHMVEVLHQAVPGATIRLTLRAARAQSAAEMLATLRRELAAHSYQLVLWQTGTVEALHRQPPEQFRQTLAEGVALVARAGADLVLIDMPYSRLLTRHADLDPYRAIMAEAALQPGVMLFPRYALMLAWAEAGQIDLEGAAKPDRRRAAAELRTCLGETLAHMLTTAAAGGIT
jgi:acyl-CoA thioesterase-1